MLARCLWIGLLGLSSWGSLAQQEEAGSVSQPQTEESAEPTATDAAETQEPERPVQTGRFETFNPSEDISEDLDVPFPVDI